MNSVKLNKIWSLARDSSPEKSNAGLASRVCTGVCRYFSGLPVMGLYRADVEKKPECG
jgi:hypothetical protein